MLLLRRQPNSFFMATYKDVGAWEQNGENYIGRRKQHGRIYSPFQSNQLIGARQTFLASSIDGRQIQFSSLVVVARIKRASRWFRKAFFFRALSYSCQKVSLGERR